MRNEIMLTAIYNELLLNDYTRVEEIIRCLVYFRQKIVTSLNYWEDSIHALRGDLLDRHKEMLTLVTRIGDTVFQRLDLLEDKLDIEIRFNRKFDKMVGTCPFLNEFIEAYGSTMINQDTIPDDIKDTDGSILTKTAFFNHILFTHYVRMVELYYFDLLEGREQELFFTVSSISEELCNIMWKDINVPFIDELSHSKQSNSR